MSNRGKSLLAAIVAWHLSCLALMFAYPHTVGRVVVSAYEACFGDIQASYGTFERVATYVAIITVTAPATALTLALFEVFARPPTGWRRKVLSFLGWQAAVVATLTWSYEVGFPYTVNQLGWALFGPPDDLYSLRNLVLPRIIGWLICTTPPALVVLWLHGGLRSSLPNRLGPTAPA